MVASREKNVEEELLKFRYFANKNRDGWGIGWYTRRGPVVFKSTKNAIKDVLFPRIASLVNSNIVIAHLRAKTKGNVRKVNSHPFSIQNYLFAHNGTMDKTPIERKLKGKYKKFEGETDSERLFHLLIQFMETYGSIHGMRRALKWIERAYKQGFYVNYINFILSDGAHFFAFSKHYKRKSRGLYYLFEDGISPSLYLSTKPIFDGDWKKLESGNLLIVDSKSMDLKVVKIC